jgi:hypothetical protein
LVLLGAGLAGWTAARLPAAVEAHGRLMAAAVPRSVGAALPQTSASAPTVQFQPIYIQVPAAAAAAPQIIHVHHYGAPPADGAAPMQLADFAVPLQPVSQPASPALPARQVAAPDPTADVLATAAYDKLRQGNKREALRLFEAAIASDDVLQPDPRRAQWQRQANILKRRWSGEAFTLVRDTPIDPASGLATGPLLGASQTGAALGYTIDPLARRALTVTARVNAATDAAGRTDPQTAQAAFGLRYQLLPALAISAERLVSLGELARDDWLLRLSSGIARQAPVAGKRVRLDAYGEINLLANGDALAAGQARALAPLFDAKNVGFAAGLGSWGSVQNTGGTTIGRFDVGPSAAVRLGQGRLNLELTADYRQRLAGQALPASGPTLALSSSF